MVQRGQSTFPSVMPSTPTHSPPSHLLFVLALRSFQRAPGMGNRCKPHTSGSMCRVSPKLAIERDKEGENRRLHVMRLLMPCIGFYCRQHLSALSRTHPLKHQNGTSSPRQYNSNIVLYALACGLGCTFIPL